MLNTVADYTYNAANIAADGVVIKGRIIPTEDVDGLGHPLRRENLAYLCEAISERNGAAYWNVPAQNAGLHLAIPKDIWAHIAEIYARNVPATTSMGSPGFVKPSYNFGDATSVTDVRVLEAYSGALLSSTDLPADMSWNYAPYYLYADDMRTTFYFVDLLRRRWMPLQIPSDSSLRRVIGKYGGAMYLDAALFDNNAPAPSTPIAVNDSTAISGFTDQRVSVSGSVTGGSGDPIYYSESLANYELYLFRSAYLVSTLYMDGLEDYYVGDVQLHYGGMSQKCGNTSPLLFVQFLINGYENGGAGSSTYVWRPVPGATFVRDANGELTDISFPVTLAYLHALVQVAFPSANFNYSTVRSAASYYRVSVSDWEVLEYPDYASLLPSAWTWTPT